MEIEIGTQWQARGKRKDLCTVIDILKTYNNAGELVKTEYKSTHDLCGQKVSHIDCSVTITMGAARLNGTY